MGYIRKLLKLFSQKERKQLAIMTFLILIMAMMEVVGVGAIGPFMTVAADPTVIQSNDILNRIYTALGIEDVRYFIAAMGIVFFCDYSFHQCFHHGGNVLSAQMEQYALLHPWTQIDVPVSLSAV